MRQVLLIIAAALSVALYRMISKGGKSYAYSRTQTTSLLTNGTEQVVQHTESGTINITNKSVIIDGEEYIYKPLGEEPIQAVLEYEQHNLSSVRVFLPEGEKLFIIGHAPVAKNSLEIASLITLLALYQA